MKRWEYTTVTAHRGNDADEGELAQLGQEGWEATGASFEYHDGEGCLVGVLLKRECPEAVEEDHPDHDPGM